MLYDKSCKDFFEWLGQNITSENILTDAELKEYNDLLKDGLVLDGEALENAMDELNNQYPNIANLTDNDVKTREKKLEKLLLIEESYEAVNIDMKAVRSRVVKEITDLETQIIDTKYLEEKFLQESLDRSAVLNRLQTKNLQLFAELNQCYTKTQTPPLFVYQMPLDQYNMKCEQFLKYFELYMRKNFDIKDYLEHESDCETKDEYIKKLDNLKQRLFAADKKLSLEVMNVKGQRQILQKFSEYNFDQTVSISSLKKSTAEMENSNKLTEIQMMALKKDLEISLQRLSDLEIEGIMHDNNKLKLTRANERLKNAKQMTNIVSDAIANAELVWMLIQLDLEKLKNKFDNTDKIQQEAVECAKRTDQLKKLPKSPFEVAKDYFVEEFATILATHLQKPVENFGYLKACFEEFVNFRHNTGEQLESVVARQFYGGVDEISAEISETEQFLKAFLYNGPVNKPQLVDPKFMRKIFEANKEHEGLVNAMKKIKDDFKVNVMDIDKYTRYQQVLWIWFLTEPKRVLAAIKEVTTAAANTQSAAMKNISGIIRKQ